MLLNPVRASKAWVLTLVVHPSTEVIFIFRLTYIINIMHQFSITKISISIHAAASKYLIVFSVVLSGCKCPRVFCWEHVHQYIHWFISHYPRVLHADEQMFRPGEFFNLATSAAFTDNTHCERCGYCSWFPVAAVNVCVCHFVYVLQQQCFPSGWSLTGFAGCGGPAKPHDSCSRQQFSTSFMHHMDTELMLHTEYHMTNGTLVIVCVCVCVCVRVCRGACFSYCAGCWSAYLWIIIPFWNVTFQTQLPQADPCLWVWQLCVCVCVFVCVWERHRLWVEATWDWDIKSDRHLKMFWLSLYMCVFLVCVSKQGEGFLHNPCSNLCICDHITEGPCHHGNIIWKP